MDWYTLLDSAMGRQMRRVRVVLRVEFMVVIVLFLFWFGLIVWEIVFCERKTDLGGQILGDRSWGINGDGVQLYYILLR